MDEKLSEKEVHKICKVCPGEHTNCDMDDPDCWIVQGEVAKLRVKALERRLARADGLLLDNYPCYDENKCKNCVGDFSEIDYRTCVGYNVLTAIRGEAEDYVMLEKEEAES